MEFKLRTELNEDGGSSGTTVVARKISSYNNVHYSLFNLNKLVLLNSIGPRFSVVFFTLTQ